MTADTVDWVELVRKASDAFAASHADLASETGVQPLALTTWRKGRNRPKEEHLLRMASALRSKAQLLEHAAHSLETLAEQRQRLTRRRRQQKPSYLQRAQEMASWIVEAGQSEVLQVRFYGSRARNAPTSPRSDWDLLVVMAKPIADPEEIERRFRSVVLERFRSSKHAQSEQCPPRLDIWPIEVSEWEEARQIAGHTAYTINQEGLLLYAA